jgi:hypothetical protein
LAGISAIVYVGAGSQLPGGLAGLVVIITRLIFVLVVVYSRVVLGPMVVVFRISENIAQLAGRIPPASSVLSAATEGQKASVAIHAAPMAASKVASLSPPPFPTASAAGIDETLENLTKLKSLLDAGDITREDFDREKARLLAG